MNMPVNWMFDFERSHCYKYKKGGLLPKDSTRLNFPILDGDVPRTTSYGVSISPLIRFARVSSHLTDFNARNKSLTAKLLQKGNRYHKLGKAFSKMYRIQLFGF